MTPASPQDGSLSLMFLEASLTAIAVVASFAWPRLFALGFSRIEHALWELSRRRHLAVLVVGLSALALRIAILPWFPVPLPFVPDDFSFLLGADTFAHGHLSNPTPAMWIHFESIHIDMQPTYMSMYFPGQALLLAAGKVLLGNPWFAVLIFSAVMCASICWMLQAWLPPFWAFLGGMLAVLRLGLFSYWVNTYTGGALIAAAGGALVLGALPRLIKTSRFRYGLIMAIGIDLLILTRPYEGMLLCLPVAAALGHWVLFGKNRPRPKDLIRRAALPLALIVSCLAWLGYYDYRAFGNPLTLPYSINRSTYAIAPYYVWQPLREEPVYRHESIRNFYHDVELKAPADIRTRFGFIKASCLKPLEALLFFGGFFTDSSAIHDTEGLSGSTDSIPGDKCLCVYGRYGDRDFYDPSLPCAIHCNFLCHRLAGNAPPSRLERRRQACRTGTCTADLFSLPGTGVSSSLFTDSRYHHFRMASEPLVRNVVWP